MARSWRRRQKLRSIYITADESKNLGVTRGHPGCNSRHPHRIGWGLKLLPLCLDKGLSDKKPYGHKNYGFDPKYTKISYHHDDKGNLLGATITQYLN